MIQHNLISIKEVMARTSMSKPTIYRHIRGGMFPAPVKIGQSSYWVEAES